MIIQKYAAYDSYARLGLANSERIICRITSEALKKKKNCFFQCSTQSSAW